MRQHICTPEAKGLVDFLHEILVGAPVGHVVDVVNQKYLKMTNKNNTGLD